MNDPVLIMGSGAMACLFAARLAQAGEEVWMLDEWTEGIEAIRTRGIQYLDSSGPKQVKIHATTHPADCPPVKDALLLVKSWQTAKAAQQIKPLLLPDGMILTLQNGLGNLEILSAELGPERASAAVTTFGATLKNPGEVWLKGEGEIVMRDLPKLDRLAERFQSAQITIRRETDLRAIQWGKLLVNAAVNPISALLCLPNGRLLGNAPAQTLMQQVLNEATQITAAEKIALPYEDPLAYVNSVLKITAENRSSMLQDLTRGAPTEINEINGALVSLGEQWKIPTPTNQALVLLIKARISG